MDNIADYLKSPIEEAKKAYRKGSYVNASFLFQKLAYLHDPEALFYLGNLIADNQCPNTTNVSSEELLRKSQDLGYLPATYKLRQLSNKNVFFWWAKEDSLQENEKPVEKNNEVDNSLQELKELATHAGGPANWYQYGIALVKSDDATNYREGISFLERAGETLHPQAEYALGKIYSEGKIVSKNLQLAANWYRKAVNQDYHPAFIALARLYLNEEQPIANAKSAENLLKRAENEEALILLGSAYLEYQEFQEKRQEGEKILLAKWEEGNLEAGKKLGGYYYQNSKFEDARNILESLVRENSTEAMYMLGDMYDKGLGVPKLLDKASFLFNKAAEMGHIDSAWRLFLLLKNVPNTKCQNSIKYFLYKAALNGNSSAQCQLAKELKEEADNEKVVSNSDANNDNKKTWVSNELNSKNFSKYSQSLRFLKQSAESGNLEAAYMLSEFYEKGLGCLKDEQLSKKWCLEAANSGYVLAKFRMAKIYDKDPQANELRQAVKWYKEAIDNGIFDATYRLAKMYRYGRGGLKDDKKANELFLLSAEHGVVQSYYELGNAYLQGIGFEKSIPNALSWLEKSIKSGNENAIIPYVNLILNDQGNDKKLLANALELLESSKIKDLPQSIYALACIKMSNLDKTRNIREGIELLEKAAKMHFKDALYDLGKIYFEGVLVVRNYQKAAKLFSEAASQGLDKGLYMYGVCCLEGLGIVTNYAKAYDNFIKAAEQGFRLAYRILGDMYEKGWGIVRNEEEAIHYYRLLANSHYDDAYLYIARIYLNGAESFEIDYEKAKEWFLNGAARHHAGCCYELAKLHLESKLRYSDVNEGLALMQEAASLKYSDALFYLGKIYHDGFDKVNVNYQKSIIYLQEASQLNHVGAATLLGMIYIKGEGGTQNLVTGSDLIVSAAKRGGAEAQYQLALLYKDGRGVPLSNVDAYTWSLVASVSGKNAEAARKIRAEVVVKLTRSQVEVAQKNALLLFDKFIITSRSHINEDYLKVPK